MKTLLNSAPRGILHLDRRKSQSKIRLCVEIIAFDLPSEMNHPPLKPWLYWMIFAQKLAKIRF